ncbi:tetratricopeptide repeat protein [Nonomuraea sp. NPDC049695]|uniref:nSTAND1 domain-containing NTPase n=1 Tax=Nonomuraea sp. NPDC049695 TaxID=3154734 RepID=UPI003440B73D
MTTSGMGTQAAPGPYRGSRAFRAEDRHRFFGRGAESHEVRKLWREQRLTVLYGASGIGKTSLLQAGVMPLFSPGAADILPLGRVSYGSSFPQAALPDHNPYVLALLMSWTPPAPPTGLVGMTIAAFLRSRPVKRDAFGEPTPILMAIDQVEELFTGGQGQQPYRRWFFGQLAEALRDNPRLRLLLSIRADRLPDLMKYERELAKILKDERGLADAQEHDREPGDSGPERYALEALGFDGALEAVTRPVEGTGRAFAEGAAEQVVRDLIAIRTRAGSRQRGQAVEPAQLQVVCESLWRSLPPETTEIRRSDVLRYADQALSEHYARQLREIAVERFNGDVRLLTTWLRLTFPGRAGGGPQAVRQSAIRSAGVGKTVVALLVKRRLLRADEQLGESSYELAYDRLLQPVEQDEQIVEAIPVELRSEDCLREAEGALREGDLFLAARLGEEALARAQEHDLTLRAQIESLLGNVAHQHGDLDRAIAHYATAARSFETSGAAAAVGPLLTAIGRLRLAQGSPAAAVRELHAAMIRVPADLTIQTELAWALWQGGHPDAAVGVLNGVLDRQGNNIDALLGRGQILAGMGRPQAALRDLERVGPLRRPFAKVAHALALAQSKRVQEAQQEMVEALAEAVDHGPVLLYAARVEELAGKSSSAAALAQQAIAASAPAIPEHMTRDARRLAGVR